MRFFHISDLHIGRRLCGFSLLEDQRMILDEILALAREQKPDGMLIAGDLYDKSMPSAEAVELLDRFLTELAEAGIPAWVISGNHDCAERVAYGSGMFKKSGLYLSRVFDGSLQRYSFEKNEKERADIYLLPFVRPAQVRPFFPDREIETTQQAVEAVLESVTLKKDRPNLLVMHQMIAGASLCESEEISVGGTDQISAAILDDFDYVALGHLHGPQKVERETLRYCGSPLKYSFSETAQKKSVTVVDIDFAGDGRSWQFCISELPLKPRHELREIRGPIGELTRPEIAAAADPEDYLHVTLTDREGVLDALGKLREVYPNLMRLDFESEQPKEFEPQKILTREKTPEELFEDFFEQRMGEPMNERQRKAAKEAWEN